MEEKHKSRLLAEHSATLEHKPIHVLDIPDEYEFMTSVFRDLTFDMSGGPKGAQRPLERPLDGGVRCQRLNGAS